MTEISRPRTQTSTYRFPPARPVTVPPAHLCGREDLLDLAAGAVHHRDQLWALLGSSEHVVGICRLLVEHIEPACAALRSRLEEHRDATRVIVAQRDRAVLAVGATTAENAWLRRELAAALSHRRIEASYERVTITVNGDSHAVVAERLTASVRDVDSRFDSSDVIDVPTTDGIDQSPPKPAEETPLVDPDDEHTQDVPVPVDPEVTQDMEPEDEGGEG